MGLELWDAADRLEKQRTEKSPGMWKFIDEFSFTAHEKESYDREMLLMV